MEKVAVTDDWAIHLGIPACDLGWEGCTGTATVGVRVHGCAFYYACDSCHRHVLGNIAESFRRFETLCCGRCGIEFTETDYSNAIDL